MKSSRQSKLGIDAFDTVGGVQVLDQCDLIASCGALSRDNGGVGKEEFPNLALLAYVEDLWMIKLTRYHLLPYLAKTLSLLASQFLYHLQSVAE
jgi:hypothetical protein